MDASFRLLLLRGPLAVVLTLVLVSSFVEAQESLSLPTAMPVANEIILDYGADYSPVIIQPGIGAEVCDSPEKMPMVTPGSFTAPYGSSVMPGTAQPGMQPGMPGPGMQQMPYQQPFQQMPYQTAWTWQLMPPELIYQSYLAGVKEPRFSGVAYYDKKYSGWLLDATLGARVGILRYGSTGGVRPEGWQFDLEGAAFPRLDIENNVDLASTDFRSGGVITYGRGQSQVKFGYYHLSSHLGDEFMLRNPTFDRLNFSRDALVLGYSYYPTDDWRLYAETAWAFRTDGGSEPWEFQFGVDYSPVQNWWLNGAPFLAVNGHLRQEHDFGGNVTLQTGWQWRGSSHGRVLRTGFHYLNGKSPQYSFFETFEQQLGIGLWYDF